MGLLVWAAMAGAMMGFENQFIYFPSREIVATPKKWGLAYDEVRFGPEGRLHGWLVPGPGTTPVTFLWLHGNAGNISHRVEWLRWIRARVGASVFIFVYQGYGLSGGSPTEANTYQDGRDALAYLRGRSDVDASKIVYYGESLGGAVAAQLAAEQPPFRLVLQSTFTSLGDMARLHYPFVPIGPWLRTRFATIEKISSARAPVLIVHGERDEIVPLEQARQLFEAAAEPKRLLVVEGAMHNDLNAVGGLRYLDTLRAFCDCEEGLPPIP